MSEPALLPDIDAVTVGWLAKALADVYGIGRIRNFSIEPIGAGTASDTKRIRLDYASAGSGPSTLICKFPPRDPAFRQAAAAHGTFRREAESYVLVSARRACRVPHAYRIASDERSINLVMEDLSAATHAGDQIAGCGPDEAAAVIDQLGDLHRVIGPLAEAGAADWMLRMPAMAQSCGAAIRAGAGAARKRFGDRFTTQAYAAIDRAAALAAGWLAARRPLLTLTHGDPRVDNVLFDRRGGAVEAVLIDWQMAGLRAPLYDVAYFLASSLPVEDRRDDERALLARYAARAGLSLDSAVADYGFELLASPTLTILSIAALPATPAIDLLIAILLDRNLAALDDWQALDLIAARLKMEPMPCRAP